MLPSSTAMLIVTSRIIRTASESLPHVVKQPIDFSRLRHLVDPPRIGALEFAARQLQHAIDRLACCRTIAGLIGHSAETEQRRLRSRRDRRRPFIRLPSLFAITERLELGAE